MAVGYRLSSASGASDVNQNTNSTAVPTGAAIGDIAILAATIWHTSADPTVTWPSGFTEILTPFVAIPSNGNTRLKIAWKRLTAADTGSYSVTYSVTAWTLLQCVLVTGAVASGSPIEATNTATSATSTTVPSTSVTVATQAFLAHFVATFQATTATPPTNFTEVQDGSVLDANYRIPGSTGTFAASGGVLSATSQSVAALIAITPAGATTPVTAVRATTWRVAAQATSTRAATWDVLAARTATRATTWDALVTVAAARATTWKVATQTTAARATTWDVLASRTAARATTWHTLARVTPTRPTTWDTLASTTGTRATTWRVRAAVSASRSTTWSVASTLTTITTTRNTTWKVAARVTGTRSATWDVRTEVSATRDTAWDTRVLVAAARATTWGTKAQVATSRTALWAVLRDPNARPPRESVLTATNAPSSALTVAARPFLIPSHSPSSHLEVSHGV